MMNKFKLFGTALLVLSGSLLVASENESKAERGSQFYKFADSNATNAKNKYKSGNNINNNTNGEASDVKKLLAELLKVAKEQKSLQQKIYNLLSEEFNPTPKKVIINGKECIENSSKDCFVMPLTKDAKKIPVLKALLTNPTPETAKNWLQWYSVYMNRGPLKVGRSFEYAMNTYGDKAYPMDITRSEVNTNTNELRSKQDKARKELLNKKYNDGSLGMYIFLSNKSLDYFAITQLADIVNNIDNKKAIAFLFRTEKEKSDFLKAANGTINLKDVPIIVNDKYFKANHIYMTPTYLAVSHVKKDVKKQAVSIGRVSSDTLNIKTYEWLKNIGVLKEGTLSDYKVWNKK